MRIDNVAMPKSSFLSIEKDMSLITNKLLKNERFKKLLYYTSKDAIDKPNLTEDQSLELFGNNIKIIPKLYVDNSVKNYVVIAFDTFTKNNTNPQFRDNFIEFDIICHFDQWTLKDFQLRPYRIAAEIDSMLDNKHLSGIGTLQFYGASLILLTNEYAGLCLLYEAIHGEEDKKEMLDEKQQRQFELDFKEMMEKK